MKLALPLALSSMLFTACSKPPTCGATQSSAVSSLHSGANGRSCDVSYSKLMNERMTGIRIDDVGIPQAEKIRHLNELNMMPIEFLNVMRGRVTINMMPGAITNHPSYANLRGVQPRGWPAGSTWDIVAGVGGVDALGLGDSHENNDTGSLAIHEASHSVDSQTRFIQRKDFLEYFNKDKGRPHPDEYNGPYRTNYPEEYFAMAIDDYYCSKQSRELLKKRYPNAFAMVENVFIKGLKESGKAGGFEDPNPGEKPTPDTGEKPMTGTPEPKIPDPKIPETKVPETKIPETGEEKTKTPTTDDKSSDDGSNESEESKEDTKTRTPSSSDARPDPIHMPRKSSMCKASS